MGMAASQARLLQLTSRKNDIGRELSSLSLQKMSLSRDMNKVSKEYQESLNTKVLKWSNNAGVSYIDLTYKNLMTPSTMNQNTAYLLTDTAGRVVVDPDYKKYAEMISPDGASGGDWESNRAKIISELTGIDVNKIESAATLEQATWDNEKKVNQKKSDEPSKKGFEEKKVDKLLQKTGSDLGVSGLSFSSGSTWAEAYKDGGTISLGNTATAATNLDAILTHLSNKLEPYFMDYADDFNSALETFSEANSKLMSNGDDLTTSCGAITGKSDGYTLDVKKLIDTVMGSYGHTVVSENSYNSEPDHLWYDIDSNAYATWVQEHDKWETEYNEAKELYDESLKSYNEIFTADQERQIAFYDDLFSSIAERGWNYNSQVTDTEYLNEMLQNNLFTLTRIDRDLEYDDKSEKFVYKNEYSTDIASNFTNVYTVNDNNAREEALVEYEYKKSIINTKETRIDTRMKDLETEQSAINTMIQGIESVKNDNVERNFSIMS